MPDLLTPGRLAALLLLLVAGDLVLRAVRRARRWRAGRPQPVDIRAGLVALPRRYLNDVHGVVAREPTAARMHVLAAGGFVLSAALVLVLHGLGLGGAVLAWLLVLACVGVIAGAELVRRRHSEGGSRFSQGGFRRLAPALAAWAVGVLVLTLPLTGLFAPFGLADPVAWAAFVAVAWASWELVGRMASGPMKHALAGALNLAFHPRPGRFDPAVRDVALRPLDLDAPRLGAETPVDLPWTQLLAADACVQCGRCEVACPAFAAGQPLNPKKLIQDVALAMAADTADDSAYAGSPYPGLAGRVGQGGAALPLVGPMIPEGALWACTTCRACVKACPMFIEHVDTIVDLRRFVTMEAGATPGTAPRVLAELAATDTQSGRPVARRFEFAVDLRPRVLAPGEAADLLLWAGEAAFDLRGQRSLRALMTLLNEAGADWAVLSGDEADTGDLARRLGDEALFQRLARANLATLGARRIGRIVTGDPHALNSLRNDYPAFGRVPPVVHHSALLLELVEAGRLNLRSEVAGPLTYHDPCYLGRWNGEYTAPRALLDRLGFTRVEMERSARNARCCGGGGGAPLTDVPGARRIPDMRMDDIRATGAPRVAVACPNCAVMLEGVTGARPEVADLAELVLERLDRSQPVAA